MKVHELKTDPYFFKLSLAGSKPWEMRLNDRLFDVGDVILLRETKYSCEEMAEGKPLDYTGRVLSRIINNIFIGGEYGLKENWVILTVSKI